MLKLVRMEELQNRRTSQISGGQQQRVALARALAPQPKVLLLDEPLSALDFKLRKEMQIELKRLQHETGITFIFVTHDQEEALTMSDRIAVMSAGRILQVGTPRDIYDRPAERFVADFIGETNFLSRATSSKAESGRATVKLVSGATDHRAISPNGPSRSGEVTIVVRPEHARIVAPRQRRRSDRHASRTSSISAPTRTIHLRARRRQSLHRAPAECRRRRGGLRPKAHPPASPSTARRRRC